MRKAGVQLSSPWWPYPAIRYLQPLVCASWSVLEFGSGASTLWLARRVHRLVSLESSATWYANVQSRLIAVGCPGTDLRLRRNKLDYVTVDRCTGREFDLVVIDGDWRDLCTQTAVRLVRPGGYVYLDNSDVLDPDHRSAVRILLEAGTTVGRFVGICPGIVATSQGLLIRTPGN